MYGSTFSTNSQHQIYCNPKRHAVSYYHSGFQLVGVGLKVEHREIDYS